MKLLIVEDNQRLALDMQDFLSKSGFVVEKVAYCRKHGKKLPRILMTW